MNASSISSRTFASIAVGALIFLVACGGSDSANDSGSSDGGTSGDVCAAVRAVADASAALDGTESVEDSVVALRDLSDALDGFAEVAPDSLRADVERVAESTSILSEIDPDAGPTDEQQAVADDEATDDSAEAIEDFARSECDVEFGS